jgi:tetratricopeptide (TPR) repeat protein
VFVVETIRAACAELRAGANLSDAAFLRVVNQNQRAEAAARAALAASPNDPVTLRTLARLYDNMGQHERALDICDTAVARGAEDAQNHFLRAIVLQHLGRFGEALSAFQRTAALDPLIGRAHLEIVQLSDKPEAAALAPSLTALFERVRDHPVRAMFVGHALAKIAEDAGDVEASFRWLQRAKTGLREQRRFDYPAAKALHEAAQVIDAQSGCESAEPIFVVGLPRTGTTLLDRILSSHAQVTSLGELPYLLLLTNAMAGAAPANPLQAGALAHAPRFDLARFGEGYVESTRPSSGATQHFIDKAPLNYLLAGLVHAALPNARIICVRRDPMDACLAIYRQVLPVQSGQYDFAYDLEDAARYVVLFESLLSRWRESLPPERFTVLDYEKLVAGIEPEVRRLLTFCDLDWDPRCLEFHQNAGPVATPSAQQVRRPIYATSVGRWRRYGALMQPALQILQAAGLA